MPGEPIGIGQIERPSAAHAIDVLRIRATPRTRAAFKDADVNLAEIIMDNSNIVPPGPEMAAFVEKYLPLPGTLRQRLANFLRRSEYFNDRAREQDRDGA